MTLTTGPDKRSWRPSLASALRLAAAAVFLLSGIEKSASGASEFAVVLDSYRILPDSLVLPVAALLPWLETFLGMSLAWGFALPFVSTVAAALFAAFTAAIASTLLRGIPLENCGCFGGLIHLPPRWTLIMDVALFSACVWLRGQPAAKFSLDRWISRGRNA